MQKKNFNYLDSVLSAIALILTVSLFFKAIMVNDTNYDVG